ncbi:MAG: SDR family oxidoreductase [Acetobacterales bacterium]
MNLGIKGKRAIVLGASKGLGYACAEALSAEGVQVVAASSSVERCEEAAEKIRKATGGKVVPALGDVSDPDNMDRLYEAAVKALGGVDILINNHGGPARGLAQDLKEEDLESQFTSMVVSPIRLTSLCFPGMVERKWGRILTIGSSGNVQPLPNMVLSNTLRMAMVGYTKTLAGELAADNVTVNIVAPGSVLTDRSREGTESTARRLNISFDEALQQRASSIPAHRMGEPSEFGALAAFLCGERAAYMTGSVWRVDGGAIRNIL